MFDNIFEIVENLKYSNILKFEIYEKIPIDRCLEGRHLAK